MLFRSKQVDNGDWVYGYYWSNDLGHHFIRTTRKTSENILKDYEIILETIGEFTGFLDKNGNKIFEGDVVRYIIGMKGYTSTYNVHISLVKFEDCNFYPFTSSDIIETEIIDNINDNPELLKEV